MRTNIVISDELMANAMQFSQTKTKKALVEEALRLFIRINEQLKIRDLRGKVIWEGDLDLMRTDI